MMHLYTLMAKYFHQFQISVFSFAYGVRQRQRKKIIYKKAKISDFAP